jgi:hypothetical protein
MHPHTVVARGEGQHRLVEALEIRDPLLVPVPVPTLLISGTVAAGKSTVAAELNDTLAALKIPNAAVDLDALVWQWPSSSQWNSDLMFENLAVLWPNYQARGVTHLVLACVLEDAADLDRYRGGRAWRSDRGLSARSTTSHAHRSPAAADAAGAPARLAPRANGRAGRHPGTTRPRGLRRRQRPSPASRGRD